MTIHNRNEAIATASRLAELRGQKKLLEGQMEELQEELLKYLHSVQNQKIDFPTGSAKKWFKLASRDGVTVKGKQFKEELPELFQELLEKELLNTYTAEYVDIR